MNKITSLDYMKDKIFEKSNKRTNKHLLFEILISFCYRNMLFKRMVNENCFDSKDIFTNIIKENDYKNKVIADYFVEDNYTYINDFLNTLQSDMSVKKYNQTLIQEQLDKFDIKINKKTMEIQ